VRNAHAVLVYGDHRCPLNSDHPLDTPDVAGQIRKLGELRDEGLLTEEEFQTKKTELLGKL
jgi:hypothetical protein